MKKTYKGFSKKARKASRMLIAQRHNGKPYTGLPSLRHRGKASKYHHNGR